MILNTSLAIGVDVGATKIASALVTRQGEILACDHLPTCASEGSTAVINRIAHSINQLLSGAPAEVAGIGIGTTGQLDPRNGIVKYALNLGWKDVPLAKRLQEKIIIAGPVWTQNDTKVEALGEYYFGSAKGCDNFVYIGIGTGIGAGIVINGKVLDGASLNAGEIGHLSLMPESDLYCECGMKGCAEAVISGVGILNTTRAFLLQGKYTTGLVDTPDLSTQDIVFAAQAGDRLAQAVFSEATRYLGALLAVFAATTNPARVVIGGGLGKTVFDMLVPAAQQELNRRVLESPRNELKIVPSSIGSSAIGASCLVWVNNESN